MHTLKEKLKETTAALKPYTKTRPQVGLILGTGLGNLARRIKGARTVPYHQIPHFTPSTVESHEGALVFGTLGGRPVVAMQGRLHAYEGLECDDITYPVRVMKALGVKTLVMSNASGGLNPDFRLGDLVVIHDHINFMGLSPLRGPNDDSLGPRFPDMSEPYDLKLVQKGLDAGLKLGFRVQKGVLVAVMGPHLETRAEYRMLRQWGADMVSMSTVPEAIVAVHAGLKVFAVSVVTDMCIPDLLKPSVLDEIIAVANEAEPKLCKLIETMMPGF